jgi:oligoendopeptidase F
MAVRKKNNIEEELPELIHSPEKLGELMGGMSDLMKKIGQAKSKDEMKKIFHEFSSEKLKESMLIETKHTMDDIPKLKRKLREKIKVNKNLIKILDSINIQNPKILELIQKENELVDQLTRNLKFLDRFYLYMISVQDILAEKENLDDEIKMLIKELNEEGILLER